MTKTSVIMDYFQESGDLVICKKCTTTYKLATVKSSTQPLRYHLKTKHGFTDERLKRPRTSSVGVNSPKRQKPITTYVEKKSQQEMYAELAASDRLSFLQISNCSFIRSGMLDKGFKSHISKDTIRSKVFEFYEEAKAIVKDRLLEGVKTNKRYMPCHSMNIVYLLSDLSVLSR